MVLNEKFDPSIKWTVEWLFKWLFCIDGNDSHTLHNDVAHNPIDLNNEHLTVIFNLMILFSNTVCLQEMSH